MGTASTDELTLSGAPESIRAARDFVRRVLDEATTAPEAVEQAALLVSELVTNAVIHTDADVCLRVRSGPVARIEVEDGGAPIPASAVPPAGSPVLPRAAEAVEPGGLGLAIVATLASRWGIDDTTRPGKVVWFELDVA
jgi:anti-sigma regulatory factor (Ser/Thr protein kinase)